jgi:hypothetical protein
MFVISCSCVQMSDVSAGIWMSVKYHFMQLLFFFFFYIFLV